jgi:hypothetical protein
MLDDARASVKNGLNWAVAHHGQQPRTGMGCHDDHK